MDFRPSIRAVLGEYQAGPRETLVTALSILVETAAEKLRRQIKDEIAMTVCEGQHEGPPTGIVCKACHDAELSFVNSTKGPAKDVNVSSEQPDIARDVQRLMAQAADLP